MDKKRCKHNGGFNTRFTVALGCGHFISSYSLDFMASLRGTGMSNTQDSITLGYLKPQFFYNFLDLHVLQKSLFSLLYTFTVRHHKHLRLLSWKNHSGPKAPNREFWGTQPLSFMQKMKFLLVARRQKLVT